MSRIEWLERLDKRPQIDLMRPCSARLAQAGNDSVSDRAWWDDRFARAIGFSRTEPRRIDLTVDDDMHDVDTFWDETLWLATGRASAGLACRWPRRQN